jgi:hypothetical protein
MAFRLEDEVTNEGKVREQFVRIISRGRGCHKFYAWRQGFNPKEHQEMVNSEMLLKLQEEQRPRDREWQAEQRREKREWQTRREQPDRDRQEWQWWRDKIASAFLVILATVLAFLFARWK